MTAPFLRGPAGVIGLAQSGRIRPVWHPGMLDGVRSWWDAHLGGSASGVLDQCGGPALKLGTAPGATDSADPKWLPYVGIPYLHFPGGTGGLISSGSYPITGSTMRVRWVGTLPPASGQSYVDLVNCDSGSAGFILRTFFTGGLQFVWLSGGSYKTVESATGNVSWGQRVGYGAIVTWNSGGNWTCQFERSLDGGVTWANLGALQTVAGGAAPSTPAVQIKVGSGLESAGTRSEFAEILQGGVITARWSAAECSQGGMTDVAGRVWSIYRPTGQYDARPALVNQRGMLLLDSNDQVYTDGAPHPFSSADHTLVLVGRQWPDAGSNYQLVLGTSGPSVAGGPWPQTAGFWLQNHDTADKMALSVGKVPSGYVGGPTWTGSAVTGTARVMMIRRQGSTWTARAGVTGATYTQAVTDPIMPATGAEVWFGRAVQMEWYGALVASRALTDAELKKIGLYYQAEAP